MMNWLLALLAFAGIMAVLATIVSTLVELVHKVLASRHGGLNAMCRALHPALSALARGAGGTGVSGLSPDAFARLMTNRPLSPGAAGDPAAGGLFKVQAHARFERLTPLQFVEQLANTDIGERLAQRSPAELRRSLRHAAFQFERYGQAQSAFFRRRTKLISGLVAFFVVALGNVNGFAIYQHLARTPDAATAAIGFASSQEALALEEQTLATERQVENLSAQVKEALASPSPAVDGPLLAGLEIVQGRLTTLNAQLDGARTQLAADQSLALPIGWAQFPYCIGGGAPGGACPSTPVTLLQGRIDWSFVGAFLFWAVSIIGTAGLLALGAPFWFDVFRSLAVLTTGARAAQAAADSARANAAAQRADSGAVRDAGRADPDALAEAFHSARGEIGVAGAAGDYGARFGDSSAQAMAAGWAPGGIRPVRG